MRTLLYREMMVMAIGDVIFREADFLPPLYGHYRRIYWRQAIGTECDA